jgi:hypothetical protein
MIDAALHTWLNVSASLVIVGLAFYLSLFPHLTDED